ncbi:hypothetical protein FQR65_LT16673 [Abscondita terminalis]|nr:hypothetical protein FQR65_LT16673 [Abscondita terminalis]
MTPHISAKKEDIAKVVLMPGDPLRAKMIAEKCLENVRLVNEVRNIFMYTGTYKGKEITVAGSGMGCPSIGIYSYELYKFYDVEAIIRIGSGGSYVKDLNVYDVFNVLEAFGESDYAKIAANIDSRIIESTPDLFNLINQTAKDLKMQIHSGRAHSSDVFYRFEDSLAFANKNKLKIVEMESYALFANAKVTNKKAACLLTVSDSFVTHEVTTPEERQNKFMDMIKIALETKTLANYLNVKLIEINHIEGHIYSSAIEDDFIFPVLSLVVSGGHTQIVLMKNDLDFNLIGETQDDAIGECYDKVARNLGLEYPGGPKIDNLHIGNELAFSFPIPKTENKFDFSFSGLKTFSLNIINSFKMKNETLNLEDFCSSFQKSAIEILISKLDLAIKEFNPKTISLAGGVSANKFLRKRFLEISNKYNIKSLIPSLKYCTDNAAMIGRVAFEYLKAESKNE